MKIITILTIFICLVGCDKVKTDERPLLEMFNKLDGINNQMNEMLSTSSMYSKEEQRKIICEDYPKMYIEQYIPITVEYSKRAGYPEFNEERLLSEFKLVQEGYMNSSEVQC